MTARQIARQIPAELLALTSALLARDIRRRFSVNSVVAFNAVAIAREVRA